MRALMRVPFEKGRDKVALPGVVELIKGLRTTASKQGRDSRLFFITASPPQIGTAIRDKLELDGIDYDGIGFKNQFRHLMRGDFGALREQLGYKLSELLGGLAQIPPGSREYLFGDDWESDPFVYSLYADIVDGRVGAGRVLSLLEKAGVEDLYVSKVERFLALREDRGHRVGGIYILRQRMRRAEELECFGRRLSWFDDYFEAALLLHCERLLSSEAVCEIAAATRFGPAHLSACLEGVASGGNRRSFKVPASLRRQLFGAGLLEPSSGAGPVAAFFAPALQSCRRALNALRAAGAVPAYERLLPTWSKRAKRGAESELGEKHESREAAE